MEARCECGAVRFEVAKFPKQTPGWLGCYCEDCQSYLIQLGRTDVMDEAGRSEVVPVYPANLRITAGKEHLRCLRLSEKGTFRWYAGCCNCPLANTSEGAPWIGLFAHTFVQDDPDTLRKAFGQVGSSIFGSKAKATPAPGTPAKMDLRAAVTVAPFMLKGALLGRRRPSPFFEGDSTRPIFAPTVLSKAERDTLRERFAKQGPYTKPS